KIDPRICFVHDLIFAGEIPIQLGERMKILCKVELCVLIQITSLSHRCFEFLISIFDHADVPMAKLSVPVRMSLYALRDFLKAIAHCRMEDIGERRILKLVSMHAVDLLQLLSHLPIRRDHAIKLVRGGLYQIDIYKRVISISCATHQIETTLAHGDSRNVVIIPLA